MLNKHVPWSFNPSESTVEGDRVFYQIKKQRHIVGKHYIYSRKLYSQQKYVNPYIETNGNTHVKSLIRSTRPLWTVNRHNGICKSENCMLSRATYRHRGISIIKGLLWQMVLSLRRSWQRGPVGEPEYMFESHRHVIVRPGCMAENYGNIRYAVT